MDFGTFDNYNECISDYLAAIKNVDDNKYDMLSTKNSKFLFYNFNNYLIQVAERAHLLRHTMTSDDKYALN